MNAITSFEASQHQPRRRPTVQACLPRRGKGGTLEAVENQTPVSHRFHRPLEISPTPRDFHFSTAATTILSPYFPNQTPGERPPATLPSGAKQRHQPNAPLGLQSVTHVAGLFCYLCPRLLRSAEVRTLGVRDLQSRKARPNLFALPHQTRQ